MTCQAAVEPESCMQQYAGISFIQASRLICAVAKEYFQSCCVLQVADRLEAAVTAALDAGYRTGDLMSSGMKQVGCIELGDILVKQITEAKH